jgi:hypothetical protein
MSLKLIYKELSDEAKNYYLSLDQPLVDQLLALVQDNYDFKLLKLDNKYSKFKNNYDEKLKYISYIRDRKENIDDWVNKNQGLKKTFEFKSNFKELGNLYFELKDAEKEIEDKYKKEDDLFSEERKKLDENKLHHLIHLLREKWVLDKKNEKDEKFRQIYQTQKEDQEREKLEEKKREKEWLEELEHEKLENLAKIKNEANIRNINQIVHFTTINYLDQILDEGIFSRNKLRKDKINSRNYLYTDPNDFGENSDWISTSISFPNYKMFYTKRMNKDHGQLKQAKGWVVIAMKSDILWKLDCRFSHTNAARSKYFTSQSYSSYEKFLRMFEDSVLRSPNLQEKFTTDTQAEVLVRDFILPEYIKEIFFEDNISADAFKESFNPNFKVTVDKSYFYPREDIAYQKNLGNG